MTDTPTYDIHEDDAYIASTIVNVDPIYDTPSNVTVTGDVRLPETVSVNGLPPHMRDPILAAMSREPAASRPAIERRMVQAALETNSLETKVKGGLGPDATAYDRERFGLIGEIHTLNSERARLVTDLAEVSHWKTTVDPETGLPVPQAVEAMTGDRRRGWEERIRLIDHQVDQLQGAEGAFRMKRALHASVETAKARRDLIEDHAEIKKRAALLEREDRINTAAKARAHMTPTVL